MRILLAAVSVAALISTASIAAPPTLTLAQHRYVSAWRQLAANLGAPQMPLTELEGRIDMPVPHYDHEKLLAFILATSSA